MVILDSRVAYTALVGAVAAQRLVELRLAKRNLRTAVARGGIEAGRGHYPWMVALHATFLASCVLETWALHRPWTPAVGMPALCALAAASAGRVWVIRTLGARWTTRVVYVPGDPLVAAGPFRWVKHPNYVVVALEMAALPLVHGAWVTALVFSAANALLLRRRIRVENALLRQLASPR